MEILFIIFFGLFGTAIGSFLNVCIDRLPAGKSIVSPPSSCDNCQRRLSWPDLIPVFSYLFLRGRCRCCKARIPQRIFWVEFGTGILFALIFWKFGLSLALPILLFYSSILIAVALVDFYHQIILNILIFPTAIIALIINIFYPEFGLHSFLFGLLGGATGLVFFLLLHLINRKGMGLGDVYLVGMIGLMTGFPNVIVAVFGGIILGGLAAIFLLIFKKKNRKEGIPFGPFLAMGTIIAFFYAKDVIDWYLSLF
jgi:leader peptidase (prepilin peptidase)/N-methyltransferase